MSTLAAFEPGVGGVPIFESEPPPPEGGGPGEGEDDADGGPRPPLDPGWPLFAI